MARRKAAGRVTLALNIPPSERPTMISPVDEIRALAAKAMNDADDESRVAQAAVVRSQAYLDKAQELIALANRIDAAQTEFAREYPIEDSSFGYWPDGVSSGDWPDAVRPV